MSKLNERLKIALQKSGRLNSDSFELLSQCGLKIRTSKNSLLCTIENFPIDILLVRDDDIPALIENNVCDLGIIGKNLLLEYSAASQKNCFTLIKSLGFGKCRLSLAIPNERAFNSLNDLENARIATTYPALLSQFLKEKNINATLISISGSVEIAPRLNMADAICDLVSTGRTLEDNHLKEVATVISSEAVLIKKNNEMNTEKEALLAMLLRRTEGVLKAQESKYIMFHAPRESLELIKQILPGCETPTIMPLDAQNNKVAVHVVSREGVFWNTLEELKQIGASSILVLPIEKMLN